MSSPSMGVYLGSYEMKNGLRKVFYLYRQKIYCKGFFENQPWFNTGEKAEKVPEAKDKAQSWAYHH